MFKCLSILEAADLKIVFRTFTMVFRICDRSKKHSVELPNNEESQRLLNDYKKYIRTLQVTNYKKKKSMNFCYGNKKEKEYFCVLDKSNQRIKENFS